MPYYIRDPNNDHNFDNHPSAVLARYLEKLTDRVVEFEVGCVLSDDGVNGPP